MPTFLPTDSNDNTIPAVRLKPAGAHTITTSGTSVRNIMPFDADTRIISIYATEDVYLNFGDDTVTAATTDHFFPAGTYYDFSIGGDNVRHYTHVAALQVSTGGTVYVSEKE